MSLFDAQKIEESKIFFEKPLKLSDEEWQNLLDNKREIGHISKDRVRQSIIEGVPSEIRGQIWCLICDFKAEEASHDPGLYEKLLTMENQENCYMISKDVFRTMPDTKFFN